MLRLNHNFRNKRSAEGRELLVKVQKKAVKVDLSTDTKTQLVNTLQHKQLMRKKHQNPLKLHFTLKGASTEMNVQG